MASQQRLIPVAPLGIALGVLTVGPLAAIGLQKALVGRLRMRPDPAEDEPLGRLRGTPVAVTADDGVPLYTEVDGPDDAPVTVVFSHGYTLSQDVWHFQRQALAGQARMVFWDQRGHGRSGPGDPANATIGQLGSDLAAVLAATVPAGGRVLLVGHSMGGMTIMALAGQRPELFGTLVSGTVLISTAASGIDPAYWMPAPFRPVGRHTTPAFLRAAARGRTAAFVDSVRQEGGDFAFLSTRYSAFGDPKVSPTVVDFLERIIRDTPIEVVSTFCQALVRHDEEASLPVLGNAPCVVITGDKDRLIATRSTQALAADIPGAELVVVPGAGHLVILESPDVVTDAISRLLQPAPIM
jgi:pimeloyl-ACP methyl ester carboxylesterase